MGTDSFDIGTPAQRKRKANKVKAEKSLRAARFEQRARDMGITEKGSVAKKVAIWERMYTAEQSGDSAAVTILYSALF